MSTNGKQDNGNQSMSSAGSSPHGILIPNRLFVGGISSNTTEPELHSLFSKYGNVKSAKIITDKAGISKGYGFITFEREEEARRILKEIGDIVLNDRKLNIAPAIKKQSYSRAAVADPVQTAPENSTVYSNSESQTYADSVPHCMNGNFNVPQAACPVMYPQVFLPQQYYHPSTGASCPTHYVINFPVPSDLSACGSGVPCYNARSSGYYSEALASESPNEVVKTVCSKQRVSETGAVSHGENVPKSPAKLECSGTDSTGTFNSGYYLSHVIYHPIINKENGATPGICTNPVVLGVPTDLRVQDTNVRDNVTQSGYFHSRLAANAPTPPPSVSPPGWNTYPVVSKM